MFPVDQVGTGGVRPMHITPDSAARIVLEEHMVLAAEEARRAGVVHPIGLGQQVELGPQRIVHELFSQRNLLLGFGQQVQWAGKRGGRERGNEEGSAVHKLCPPASRASIRLLSSAERGGVAPGCPAT
jgi:hypothetical protein